MHVFDIIGPIMIGPSSSHTAGAARIGRVTRKLLGETPVRADIGLHGSFAMTYQGHGTDRAIVGGLMDMDVADDRLRDSLALAEAQGLEIVFHTVRLRGAHPNTVVIEAQAASGKRVTVQAASVGGGSIRVQYLNGLEVGFSGEAVTLIIQHTDTPGAIADVSVTLAAAMVNIATMRVFRREAGGEAVMALELDETPAPELLCTLRARKSVRSVTLLDRI